MPRKYSLKEKKDDPTESVILVEGLTNETTFGEVLEHLEYTKKSLKSALAQKEVNTAQDLVAEAACPWLKELKDEHYVMIALYLKRKGENSSLEERIQACEETIESYTGYVEDIKSQIGILDPNDLV